MASGLLAWLNFFIADVRDGLGPYLGVYLKEQSFLESQIGFIMTFASLSALCLGVPFGILIDRSTHKRFMIAIAIILILVAILCIYFINSFVFVLIAQSLITLSGTFLAPAFTAITLGIVGQNKYTQQTSKNEIYKHAGTVFGATISLGFAYFYGIKSIFIITILMGIFSLFILSFIPKDSINDTIARGKNNNSAYHPFWSILWNKKILLISFIMFCFHLSNAHMLPLLSQRAHTLGIDTTGAYAAITIIIAQTTMIIVVFFSANIIKKTHNPKIYFYLMSIALCVLILRGYIAGCYENMLAMIIAQILDGIGAGITGIILPLIAVILLKGSGYINTGFSFIITIGSIGGALSSTLGGFTAQYLGYQNAYIILSSIAFIALSIWILKAKTIFEKL